MEMDGLPNDYWTVWEPGIPMPNFSDFALDTRLALFQQDPSKDYPHIVGLSANEFRTQCDQLGQARGFGAVGFLDFNPIDKTFDAKVLYDKDFFSSHTSAEGESFEDIRVTAVNYEFRKIFEILQIRWANPEHPTYHVRYNDLYETMVDSMEAAPPYKLDKFMEYLERKTYAEHPEEVDAPMLIETIQGACAEYMFGAGLSDDDFKYVLRNFRKNQDSAN